jgi:hypothetical protein
VGKLVTKERRVWKVLSCMSRPSNMQSFIVWMVNGARDRRGGDDAKSDELLEGAEGNGDNIGIFVERRMKTGRMRLYASHLP